MEQLLISPEQAIDVPIGAIVVVCMSDLTILDDIICRSRHMITSGSGHPPTSILGRLLALLTRTLILD